jgi:hypothetical protein
MSLKEAIMEQLDSLTEDEQLFLLDMLMGVSNGLVNSISYDAVDQEKENVTITYTIIFD